MPNRHVPAGDRGQVLQRQLGQRERYRVHAARGAWQTAGHEKIEFDVVRVIPGCQRLILEHLFTQDFGRVRVQVINTVVKRLAFGVTQDIGDQPRLPVVTIEATP